MSDTQSITYNTGLNAVAVDSVGNLVTDSAGNLVIPIEPILLSPSAGFPRGDGAESTGCQTIAVTLNGNHTETFRICDSEDRVVSDVGIVNGRSGLTLNMRTLQKRFGDTVTLSLAIQTHFKRKWNKVTDEEGNVIEYCSQYTTYGHRMRVTWNGEPIDGESVYRCGGSVHVGKVTIDFNSATVSLDTSAMPDSMLGAECGGCVPEPPIEIIVIEAPYAWCNTLGSVIYTEAYFSGRSRYWENKETEITVYPGEDHEEKINDASICCVEAVSNVAYVTLESLNVDLTLSGDRYWKTNDTKPLHVEQAITVYRCYNKDTKEYLWAERYPDSTNTRTGRIWSYGDLPDNYSTACGGDYSTANNVKVKSPGEAWVTPSRNYTVSASVTYDGEDYAGTVGSPEFHIIPCGEKLYAQLVGTFHPYLDAPVSWQDLFSAALEIDGGIKDNYDKLLERFASQSPFAVIGGFVECSNGKLVVVETSTMIKDGTVSVEPAGGPADDTETPYFEHKGNRYYITEEHGYLCEVTELTLRNWAVSPCQAGGGVIDSVYLPEDKSAVYILSNNQPVMTNQIKIIGSGSGQYSITTGTTGTSSPGTVYYWNGNAEPEAVIDEEFE
jgi:hypothetical protein